MRCSNEDWRGSSNDDLSNSGTRSNRGRLHIRRRDCCIVRILQTLTLKEQYETVRTGASRIAVAVDTSGSIDSELLGAFCQELNSILSNARPDGVQVIYCDSRVNKIQDFEQDEPIALEAIGRGGTAFSPVFDTINAQDTAPACLIYFTDLDCSDTPSEPEYPVLWATDLGVTKNGPFGQTVRITK